jgi:hypothetical protein
MNSRDYDEKEEKTDYEDWKEADDSRRYREWQSDNRSVY